MSYDCTTGIDSTLFGSSRANTVNLATFNTGTINIGTQGSSSHTINIGDTNANINITSNTGVNIQRGLKVNNVPIYMVLKGIQSGYGKGNNLNSDRVWEIKFPSQFPSGSTVVVSLTRAAVTTSLQGGNFLLCANFISADTSGFTYYMMSLNNNKDYQILNDGVHWIAFAY